MPTSLSLCVQYRYNILSSCSKIFSKARLKSQLGCTRGRTTLIHTRETILIEAHPPQREAWIQFIRIARKSGARSYLESPFTVPFVDTPVSYFTITIRRADNIILSWVEVKWHNITRMSHKGTKWITRLQKKVKELHNQI